MESHSSFGWLLLILGLVIAAAGLLWILAPSIPVGGSAAGCYPHSGCSEG